MLSPGKQFMNARITRRAAVKATAAAPCLLTILPAGLARSYSANEKLNIALVGCGTRGRGLMEALERIGENLVAMCDVNEQRAARAYRMAPDVPKYIDYRRMLDYWQWLLNVSRRWDGGFLLPESVIGKIYTYRGPILSTGGTFRVIHEGGVEVREVADYTGFPEMMDGRLKTLHPKVHGGILGRRDVDGDVAAMQEQLAGEG